MGSRDGGRTATGGVRLIATTCAVCETDEAEEVYPDTLSSGAATSEVFSARRIPDRVHYRMVRCTECGLLRSNPILSDDELTRLYRGSTVTYQEEARFTRKTYVRYLELYSGMLPKGECRRPRLLEIGCGNGFFLEQAAASGFDAYGVEPSRGAIQEASESVRGQIVNDIFRPGLFAPDSFDVVCAFQVFDHVSHPNEVLRACREVLRPGGLALFINHDVGAWTNRLLGERSPVIDVEHIYLFNRDTMSRIFEKNGFEVMDVFAVENSYPLYYWLRMAPGPASWKKKFIPALRETSLGRREFSWKAGNLGLVARRAEGSAIK